MSAHSEQGENGHGLARFAGILREHWWLVVLTVVILGGLAFALSYLVSPRYTATAQVAYSQRDAEEVSKALTDAGTAGLPHTLSSDALVLQTSDFAARVSKTMGGSVSAEMVHSAVRAYSVAGVEVIDIRATSSQADLAAGIANTCADEFVKARREEIRGLLQSALDFVRGRTGSTPPSGGTTASSAALEQQRYALSSLLASPIADYKVLDKATAPASPYLPRVLLDLLYGLGAGLILGLLLALLVSVLDQRITDQATLERVMDLPVLGVMPTKRGGPGARTSRTLSTVGFKKGNEALLESMKTLRSNLKVLGFGETSRTMLVTSRTPGEGKNALAVNLTLGMALAGDRVILVDADLRNPMIDKYLDIPNTEGLAEVLTDPAVGWSERIQAVDVVPFADPRLLASLRDPEDETGVSKFLCLTSGAPLADPTGALESPALANLLAELQGYSDYVIVDGPPMLIASDALIIAKSVDAVIIASALGKGTAPEARQVSQLLARAEVQAFGLVICGTRSSRSG